ncbi:alpha/beta hydrolase family protein [Deinococcus sp.]|uniref:alpha/beta hydrolase family protein n=1 Tax=Deinococcus sp. TaxID=47478 RepID=UPI003B59F54B
MYEYFENNYPWSVNVALAVAQGGQMSEIDDACRDLRHLSADTPHHMATEAWFQSWVQVGERLAALATENELRGRRVSAGTYFFRATIYLLVAERVMGWTDSRRGATYRRALETFRKGHECSSHRTERFEVRNEKGEVLSAYLRLPAGDGPFPTVLFFNGFDTIKEMHYLLYAEDAVQRGLAILFIDQEGTGEAMRLHGVTKRVDAECSVAPFIDLLQTRPDIDAARIGVAGISNGGYDAPRAAIFESRLMCVGCLGAFFNGDDYLGRFESGRQVTVTRGLADLDDHMMTVMGASDVESAYRKFAERDLSGVIGHLSVPLLVVHGEHDRQVPVWHAEKTVAGAVGSPDVEFKLFGVNESSAEHCGGDNTRMHGRYLFDWMAEHLR